MMTRRRLFRTAGALAGAGAIANLGRAQAILRTAIVADGVTDNAPAINAAIAALPPAGGFLTLPPGIIGIAGTINAGSSLQQNVRLVGQGAGHWHDIGPNMDGTALRWIGAPEQTMMRMAATPGTGYQALHGCGLTDITLDGNCIAANGLDLVSLRLGQFRNVTIRDCLAWGMTADVCLTGEAAGVFRCQFDSLTIVPKDTPNGGGMLLTGHDAGRGLYDTSHCTFTNCEVTHSGMGVGVKIAAGDANRFYGLNVYRSSGNGVGILLDGAPTCGNYFFHCDPGAGQITQQNGADGNVFIADTRNYGGTPTVRTGALHYFANGGL